MSSYILGSQYFRPPFPKSNYWAGDMKAMKDAGLNTVQLWLVWGWCEPEPGRYVFDDYDRIADLAAAQGMNVMLSTLPEINPFWMPRVHPDGVMVDIEDRPVLSCNRGECLSGLVPGLCSDHPEVRRRMTAFLTVCGEHFGPRANLAAWDVWNENRWRNNAPDYVCFCAHSLAAFRAFLATKYGSLEKLSEAWGRRYCDWQDVRVGRLKGVMSDSFPEWHDFTAWMCARAQEMIRWRIEAVRRGDSAHPISSHTGNPSILGGVNLNENIFSRGVDWDIAEGPAYGYSSFPTRRGHEMSPVDFCVRAGALSTAGGGKPIWMSELQGGPGGVNGAFDLPLPGVQQQAWVWTGISRGAKAMVFWCWRPEVFGLESNGFGFTAADGFYADRARAMKQTADVLAAHARAAHEYQPDAPEVALLFQRDSYFYSWMTHQNAQHPGAQRFLAWARALERSNIPYAIHDDRHLPPFAGLKLIIVPDAAGLDDAAADWLARFARAGGTVFVEGAAGQFGPDTYFRYPGDRPFYRKIGLIEDLHRANTRDRRTIPAGALGNEQPVEVFFDKCEVVYKTGQNGLIALEPDGLPILASVAVGRGRAVCLGGVVGQKTEEADPRALDALVGGLLALAKVSRKATIVGLGKGFATFRLGRASGRRLLMVTNFAGSQYVELTIQGSVLRPKTRVADWFGHNLRIAADGRNTRVRLTMKEHDYAVLEWNP